METVLLTGGAGYIGSHIAVELITRGYTVVIADNLSNSDKSVIEAIRTITGIYPKFYEIDVKNKEKLTSIFKENSIDAVIHLAGFKAVGESVKKPTMYYRNNIDATLTLLEVMKGYDCKRFIFSSSATVYGEENVAPYTEEMKTGNCTNPYGKTKYFIEEILKDEAKAYEDISVVLLRYFNPIGAHSSGLIGEKPNGIPNNLMPYITQVAAGIREKLNVFGNDYNTPDGTGVRDYIHVVDLAIGHVKALEYSLEHKNCEVFNLGTGTGYSVLDVVNTFMKVNDIDIPYEIAPRRPGDIAICYANNTKAKEVLHWIPELTLEDMCKSSWNFEKKYR